MDPGLLLHCFLSGLYSFGVVSNTTHETYSEGLQSNIIQMEKGDVLGTKAKSNSDK
jgi:hypothetical protein